MVTSLQAKGEENFSKIPIFRPNCHLHVCPVAWSPLMILGILCYVKMSTAFWKDWNFYHYINYYLKHAHLCVCSKYTLKS